MDTPIQTDKYGFPVRRDEDKIFVGLVDEARAAWAAYFALQSEENTWRDAH